MAHFSATVVVATLMVFEYAAISSGGRSNGLRSIQVNGVQLHFGEQGKGPPLIFVHGALDDYRMWLPVADEFAKHFRVIDYSRRYNYPNRNRLRANHSAEVEAEDLAGLIRGLKLGRTHIVAHSYGALTALILAVKHPELVRSMVLAEAPVLQWAKESAEGKLLFDDFMDRLWRPAGEASRLGDDKKALRLAMDYFVGKGAFDQMPAAVQKYLESNAKEWKALTTSNNAFPGVSRDQVSKLGMPVLMLSGEKSLPILKFVDQELQPLLKDGERVVITGAGHEMWAETPEACRKATLEFLMRRRG